MRQTANSGKSLFIAGHNRAAQRQGVSRDEHVMGADGRARILKLRADGGTDGMRRRFEGHNLQHAEHRVTSRRNPASTVAAVYDRRTALALQPIAFRRRLAERRYNAAGDLVRRSEVNSPVIRSPKETGKAKIATILMPKDEIILITRADDMGYTHTGNLAVMECLGNGFIRSAAILVIAPWFEEAAKLARENPQFCYGIHLGLIGEWRGYRWRPVLPYSEVPTLVDEDGFFWQSPREFWGHNPNVEEIEKEFTAQIDLAKRKGVPISYLDSHYVMPYNERYRPIMERLGEKYGLPVSCLLGEHELHDFGIYHVPPNEKEKSLEQVLRSLTPGVHLLIAHPGLASMENDALVHSEPEHVQPEGVGRMRAAETVAYTSPRIKQLVGDLGIKLMSYSEFGKRVS